VVRDAVEPTEVTLDRMPTRLLVKLTAGDDAPERCSQAFTVSAVATSSGVPVSLWLTGEAAWLALPGRAEGFVLPHSAPLAELRDAVLGSGTLTLCSQCAARREIDTDDVLPGVRLAGAAVFVAEALEDGTQALVY
jgi:predicted peroxiredoxin